MSMKRTLQPLFFFNFDTKTVGLVATVVDSSIRLRCIESDTTMLSRSITFGVKVVGYA